MDRTNDTPVARVATRDSSKDVNDDLSAITTLIIACNRLVGRGVARPFDMPASEEGDVEEEEGRKEALVVLVLDLL